MTPDALLWIAGGAIAVVAVGGLVELINFLVRTIVAARRSTATSSSSPSSSSSSLSRHHRSRKARRLAPRR